MMLEEIIKKNNKITDYKITIQNTKSYEKFYVHEYLETVRKTNTTDTSVTIYLSHDGYMGHSTFTVYDYEDEADINKKLDLAVFKASLINNEYYEIVSDNEEVKSEKQDMASYSLEEIANKVSKIVFDVTPDNGGSLNATEVFAYEKTFTVINSKGVNKTDVKYSVMVEAIPTWTQNDESVELYEAFTISSLDEDVIRNEIAESLKNTKARFEAKKIDNINTTNVIFNNKDLSSLYGSIVSNISYAMVYSNQNFYKISDMIQKANAKDKLNITLTNYVKGSPVNSSFDADGFTLKPIDVVCDGKVISYHGTNRYAYYLKEKATGDLPNIVVSSGSKSYNEFMKEPYFECVSLSGLQVDLYNDYIGGEVRLGYYFDGKNIIPVTGVSVSAKLSDVINNMTLSSETKTNRSVTGPAKVLMPGMNIL